MSNPLEDVLFDLNPAHDWHMQNSERCALTYLLSRIKPDISIEVGTFHCGSLGPISALSKSVYSLDVSHVDNHQLFPNTTFLTGDSAETLPPIIDEINRSSRQLNFILVDGSHAEEGVRLDLVECLRYRPKSSPTFIVMHDSANPAVRKGIERAPWNECPYVHLLDLDFVPGMLYDRPDIAGQIWGGLAVAVMLPSERRGPVPVHATFAHSLSVLVEHSIYSAMEPA